MCCNLNDTRAMAHKCWPFLHRSLNEGAEDALKNVRRGNHIIFFCRAWLVLVEEDLMNVCYNDVYCSVRKVETHCRVQEHFRPHDSQANYAVLCFVTGGGVIVGLDSRSQLQAAMTLRVKHH